MKLVRIALSFALIFVFSLAIVVAVTASSNTPEGIGKIAITGSMGQPRSSHTSTLLPNGLVLIAGGMVENGVFLDTAELYDPATGRFTSLPAMSARRVSHTATLLSNGKVLLAGGMQGRELQQGRWTGNAATVAELFDPQSRTFSPAGKMVTPRTAHEAILLPSGKVLILGGWDGERYVEVVEVFDPATNRFSSAGRLTGARAGAVAVALRDGRVLFCGGDDASGKVSAEAEIFDPATSTATRVGDMAIARHKHAGLLLADGRVLITGGSDNRDWQGRADSAEIFDPSTRSFTTLPAMHVTRFKHPHATVLLKTGNALIAGGNNSFEVFDPHTGKFEPVPGTTGDPIFFANATLLRDGRVLVTGGYGYGSAAHAPQATNHAWIYEP